MANQAQKTVKAKYQANKNVFMTCYLDIIEANAEGVRTTIGIRKPGDSVLPPGTKLYLTSQAQQGSNQSKNQIETLQLQVIGVENQGQQQIQVCSPITRGIRSDLRQFERKKSNFEIAIVEMAATSFNVVEGSLDGLTVVYKASQLLMGIVVGKQYHMQLTYKEMSTASSIPIQLSHIHYDWISLQHFMGLKILKLDAQQELILNHLLDPDFKIEFKQKATVDTEEARIRPDL